MKPTLIFTDLDATLLDHHTYEYDEALPLLHRLNDSGIPVIFVTSKTESEVRSLQEKMHISLPFIVENGGAIIVPENYQHTNLLRCEPITLLGKTYQSCVEKLQTLRLHTSSIQGFSDMSIETVMQLTGLSQSSAIASKSRLCSEPFILEDESRLPHLRSLAAEDGFSITKGGRFYHLIDAQQNKGRAVSHLTVLYEQTSKCTYHTIALGDSENDFSMLQCVDQPILIPRHDGTYAALELETLIKAPLPGPAGWAATLEHIFYPTKTTQLEKTYDTLSSANNPFQRGDSMITKCLFPAAGYGTRFLPATKAMPKEMLPILTKPLIQYGVEEAYDAGCDVMAIITGRGKRAITDHFDISYELEHQIQGSSKESLLTDIRRLMEKCTFTYTRQNEMKGLGDAIYKGKVLVGEADPFAVILADDLCINADGPGVLSQMIQLYNKYRCCIVAIMEVPHDQVHKYGVISGREIEDGVYMIDNMVEKPANDDAPSNLAIIGRYILTPDIFSMIEKTEPGKNGELQITDSLMLQANKGMVLGYKFQGKRFDCGSVDGFVEATNYFYSMQI